MIIGINTNTLQVWEIFSHSLYYKCIQVNNVYQKQKFICRMHRAIDQLFSALQILCQMTDNTALSPLSLLPIMRIMSTMHVILFRVVLFSSLEAQKVGKEGSAHYVAYSEHGNSIQDKEIPRYPPIGFIMLSLQPEQNFNSLWGQWLTIIFSKFSVSMERIYTPSDYLSRSC